MRRLLVEQAPQLAHLPLRRGPAGWDNAHWLLGDDLAVRLPRRSIAAHLVVHEARWLPVLAPGLPVAVPVPVHHGAPGAGYPHHWNVVPWWRGRRLDEQVADEAVTEDLAVFLAALHVPAPDDAPHNPHRGVPLEDRRDRTTQALADVRRRLRADGPPPGAAWLDGSDIDAAELAYERGAAAPPWRHRPTWIHGDLHPGNVLVDAGRVRAVVDWGDVAAGDPAADLAVRWWALPRRRHERFVAALPHVDDHAWTRAAGWAAAIGAYLLSQAPRAGDRRLTAVAGRTWRRLARDLGRR